MKKAARKWVMKLIWSALCIVLLATLLSASMVQASPRAQAPGPIYFPLMFRRWFEPFTYSDNFSNWNSGWPYGDIRRLNTDGSVAEEFTWGYYDNPDGTDSYLVRIRDNHDHFFMTGPGYVMGNFAFEVQMRGQQNGQQLFEYGILLSPTPIDPANHQGDQVYTFQIRQGYSRWVVRKWKLISHMNHYVYPEFDFQGDTNHLTETAGFWNLFRIERVGTELRFYLRKLDEGSYTLVHTHSDPNLPELLYMGFFAANPDYTQWMGYEYDYVSSSSNP